MSQPGYAGSILKINLTDGTASNLPTDDYADRFIGGRGLAAKLYWDHVAPQTGAFDPANCLIFATGPLAGFTRLAGSRWEVCGKSPIMDPPWFSHGVAGGSWGVQLKFAGYDALMVQGRSEKPVYIFVHDGTTEIRDAAFLTGKNVAETCELLKAELGNDVRIATTSPAGENLVSFASILTDEDANAGSGFGAVMGSKHLKAIVVRGNEKPVAAQPERLKQAADRIYQLRGPHQLRQNKWMHEGHTKRRACYGCVSGCSRQWYRTEDGRQVKFFCHFADYYETAAVKYYGSWNEVVVHAADLIHKYSLDSFVMEAMILWLGRCYEAGILTEKETGLPLSKIGSPEFIETLVRKIACREGFGDILAQGTMKAAGIVGRGSADLIGDSISTRANDFSMYDPRLYIVTGLLYATEPRKPIQQLHEVAYIINQWLAQQRGQPEILPPEIMATVIEKFWGSRAAADFSTCEGQALAAKKIQDREYAKESLVLCDFVWPILWVKEGDDHVGDSSLESQVFSAVTGRETDEAGLNWLGEGIFNLQRAVRLREGWGGRQGDKLLNVFHDAPLQTARFNEDCIVPGPHGEPVSRKGQVVARDRFEELKNEYYELRGWDIASGLMRSSKLRELGLADLVEDLEKRGLSK